MNYQPDMELIMSHYRHAKADSGKLAKAMGFVVLQEGDPPKPAVITTTRYKKRFKTWHTCWSWLYQVWQDRQPRIPMAILID